MTNLLNVILSNPKEYRAEHLSPNGYSNLDLYHLANWQDSVYGNHTIADIMDAYNDAKLQYVM